MNAPRDTLVGNPGPAVAARVDELLIQLEKDRCQAMMAGDRDRLKQILHPDLIHVHAKGQVDSFESYFESGGFKVNYTTVQRFEDLKVQVFGHAALMTGRQLLQAVRKATGDIVHIDSQVMQVWVLNDSRWQQLAFQTTPTEMSLTPKS